MLVAGLEGHICDHCIEQAHSIMNEELGNKKNVHSIQSTFLNRPR